MANDKPTILVTRRLPEPVEARLVRDFDARLNPTDDVFGTDALIAAAAEIDADGLLMCPTERFTADVIERLPARVQIAASYSVGVDHVDLKAAAKRGLVITNTPDVLTDATAEVAMLLMLGAARRAHEGEKLVRSAAWKSWAPTFMLGTQLTGKRLGIVGMGGIGRAVATRARAFGMTVHYHNRTRLSTELEDGATYHATLDGLLPEAEFLSLHCPATPETHHLLNAETIARLPDGAIVVNTSRGAVVDDEALIAALRSGKVLAAGLDVFEGEPNVNPAYRDLPNTFLMPHIGSATVETRAAMGMRAVDNLEAWFATEKPRDRVA